MDIWQNPCFIIHITIQSRNRLIRFLPQSSLFNWPFQGSNTAAVLFVSGIGVDLILFAFYGSIMGLSDCVLVFVILSTGA